MMPDPRPPLVYRHTDHGPEIFPRTLRFTSEEASWRRHTTDFLLRRLRTVPGGQAALPVDIRRSVDQTGPDGPAQHGEGTTTARLWFRERVTEILQTLQIVNEILHVLFRSPDWGNQPHVIDELVYMQLARRSKIEDATRHLASMREAFPDWDAVADAPPAELRAAIAGGGLEEIKVDFIQGALRMIRKRFARIDEADLATLSDTDLEGFLREMPGVGPKSSACILMYARGTDIFAADTHCIRTITRLGVFAPLGFAWTQQQHKQAEADLRTLIPPHLRSALHRNLVALGRQVCRPRSSLCPRCELRKLCAHYRQDQRPAASVAPRPTAIDVFSGAGGFSLGLEQAGFEVVAAIDNDRDAVRTYRLNHPSTPDHAVLQQDARQIDPVELSRILGDRPLDLLAGGPPCQGFSMMGNRVPHRFKNGEKRFGSFYRFEDDDRNHLFSTMVVLARALRPCYVVIENVPGLGTARIREKTFADHIAQRLAGAGYAVRVVGLEAANFGIPQRRHRYFIVGVRHGEALPDLEELTHRSPDCEPAVLKCALFDLPPLGIAGGSWIAEHTEAAHSDPAQSGPYLERLGIRGTTRILFNHVTRYNNDQDVTLFSNLGQGETYFRLVERLTAERGQRPAFARYGTANFQDKYYRLPWEGLSKTIVSHLNKDGNSFVHPLQNRTISVREAARIQSFPDDYIFCGGRGPQYTQIGNAVPPAMARAIGQVLLDALHAGDNALRATSATSPQPQLTLW